jgi:hypothetical protein
MTHDTTMNVTDTAVEALAEKFYRIMWPITHDPICDWSECSPAVASVCREIAHHVLTRQPKPENVERLAEIMKGIHISGLQPSWPDIARAILALYAAPPEHRPLTDAYVAQAALVAADAWREWAYRTGDPKTGWQVVVCKLVAFLGATPPDHADTRVRELEALTVEPPPRGTLTEDDVIRIAEQTNARSVARGHSMVWAVLNKETQRRLIDQTRDCLSAASYEAEITAASDKGRAQMKCLEACEHIACGDDGWRTMRNLCLSTVAVAHLRDAYEAMRKTTSPDPVATMYLENGLTEAQQARGPTEKLHQASCMDRIQKATEEFVWNETVQGFDYWRDVMVNADRMAAALRASAKSKPEPAVDPRIAILVGQIERAHREGNSDSVTLAKDVLSALDIAAQGDRAGGV